MSKIYKVYKIENGIVIDHIPNKKALSVLSVLGLDNEHDSLITMGINLSSDKMNKKDVIKIENRDLSVEELNKIAIVAPNASVNIIKDSIIVKKFKASIPETIRGIISCLNPNCITRNEDIESIFYYDKDKNTIKCHYCERTFNQELIRL